MAGTKREGGAVTSNFYRDFEGKHRGSRALIKSRLGVYLPFIKSMKQLYPDASAIDLGCGRGEWLELLQQEAIDAIGVDSDDGMLSVCEGFGFKLEQAEAVAFLRTLADESQAIVTGFHIAEHIPFNDLQALVQEALRVLRPAGLLILETPNPENIVVGTVGFYIDPSHQRPLPPSLLSFLPDYYGFGRTKILRLQEELELHADKKPSLWQVFNGVSPDYAVIAQKNGTQEQWQLFDSKFDGEHGLTLHSLSSWYDEQQQIRIDQVRQEIGQAQLNTEAAVRQTDLKIEDILDLVRQNQILSEQALALAQRTEARSEQALALAQRIETGSEQALILMQQINAKLQQFPVLIQQADARTQQTVDVLNAVYASNSWRITAPLRWVSHNIKYIIGNPTISQLTQKHFKQIAKASIEAIHRQPMLRRHGVAIVKKLGLYGLLRAYYFLLRDGAFVAIRTTVDSGTEDEYPSPDISPRAQGIYDDLLAAIKARREAN